MSIKLDQKHKLSIWASDFVPDWQTTASREQIEAVEARLGLKLPKSLIDQLLIQNGGLLITSDAEEFDDEFWKFIERYPYIDAAIDGISPIEEWELASVDDWFNSVDDIEGLDRLVKIACHSESQLCLDYRGNTSESPKLTLIFLGYDHEVTIISSIDEFINSSIEFKGIYALPTLD